MHVLGCLPDAGRHGRPVMPSRKLPSCSLRCRSRELSVRFGLNGTTGRFSEPGIGKLTAENRPQARIEAGDRTGSGVDRLRGEADRWPGRKNSSGSRPKAFKSDRFGADPVRRRRDSGESQRTFFRNPSCRSAVPGEFSL